MDAELNRRLFESIQSGDLEELVEVLKEYRHNTNIPRLEFNRGLCCAVRTGDAEMTKHLIRAKADITYSDHEGLRPLHYAAEIGSVELVKMVLSAGSPVNVVDINGASALHVATQTGHKNVVQLLLDEGAPVNRSRTYDTNETPLHIAAKTGRPDIIRILVQRRADVNLTASEKRTPLHMAVKNRHLEAVAVLCQLGANVNQKNARNKTPLLMATEQGSHEIAEELLLQGADPTIQDRRGQSSLHCLASGTYRGPNQLKIAELLIQTIPDIDHRDSEGCTPLHITALSGNAEVAILLITGGADINAQEHVRGETALNIAINHNRTEVARLLISLGADVNIPDKSLTMPLHNIQGSRSADKLEIAEMLIQNGAALNSLTAQGYTPLDRCVFHFVLGLRNQEVLKALVRAGSHLRPLPLTGRPHHNSPLCWLTWHGEIHTARFLVNCGWDIRNENWLYLPGKTEQANQFLEWLRELIKEPNSLWGQCRSSIRNYLNDVTSDTDISPLVSELPLPTFLKRHLMLEQEVRLLDEEEDN